MNDYFAYGEVNQCDDFLRVILAWLSFSTTWSKLVMPCVALL